MLARRELFVSSTLHVAGVLRFSIGKDKIGMRFLTQKLKVALNKKTIREADKGLKKTNKQQPL